MIYFLLKLLCHFNSICKCCQCSSGPHNRICWPRLETHILGNLSLTKSMQAFLVFFIVSNFDWFILFICTNYVFQIYVIEVDVDGYLNFFILKWYSLLVSLLFRLFCVYILAISFWLYHCSSFNCSQGHY